MPKRLRLWLRSRSYRNRKTGRLSRWIKVIRWSVRLALVLLIADLFYLAVSWPNWNALVRGPVPKSNFISNYEGRQRTARALPPLRWKPVAISTIPDHVIRAVIVAEDSRFYQHRGFDLVAFKEAMDYNLSRRRLVLGASTISQQTVKNLFLSGARSPLRKWHELILTWGMEQNLTKRRILELYLNLAEFGQGIYGVQAAAWTYWGVPVSQLGWTQAAGLAASLPSPRKHNPSTGTPNYFRRTQKILGFMRRYNDSWVQYNRRFVAD